MHAHGVYQALSPPPPLEGPGYEARDYVDLIESVSYIKTTLMDTFLLRLDQLARSALLYECRWSHMHGRRAYRIAS